MSLTQVRFCEGFQVQIDEKSITDLDKCKQFNAVNGYNYDAFFKLTELDNHNLDNETIVNLRLFVVASKDAHILLSDIDSVIPEAQVYEIG